MRELVVAMWLVSCTLAPHYERPALPVPDQFAAGSGGLAAADQGWRTMFRDPRLQALIGLALANNRDLRVAALNIEVAHAQYQIQRGQLLPTVGGIATGSRLAGGALGSSSGVIPLVNDRFYAVGVTASWELDLFGRIRSLTAQALEQYLATVEARRAAHLALVGQVVAQYLASRSYAEQYEVAVRTEAATRQIYELTKQLFDEGQRSELDLRAVEAQWQSARGQLPKLCRLSTQAADALAVLIGGPLPGGLAPPQPLATEQMIAELAPGIPSQVLLRRPDVLEAEHQLEAANANIGAARATFFPQISLTGLAGTVSSALSMLFSGGTGLFAFSGMISEPIFAGGANVANLHAADAQKRIRIAQYEKTIQTAFREVADALAARDTFEHELEAQVAQEHAEQVRYDLSLDRYRHGVSGYLDVLSAQSDLYASQQAVIQLRADRLTNLADLYRALGGGWRER